MDMANLKNADFEMQTKVHDLKCYSCQQDVEALLLLGFDVKDRNEAASF